MAASVPWLCSSPCEAEYSRGLQGADCQRAGTVLHERHETPVILDGKGATRFVLYRKDRVGCERGEDVLREHRLSPESKTRRVVATCCQTPMCLEFSQGHWLSLYGGLWPVERLPALELRTMTRDRLHGVDVPGDVPNPATHNLSFYGKLFWAWAAMRFRTPEVHDVQGKLDEV